MKRTRKVSLCLAALWAVGSGACDDSGDTPGGSANLTGGAVGVTSAPDPDADSDFDGVADRFEGDVDADGDGTPAYLDPDETTVNFPAGDAVVGAADAGSVAAGDGSLADAGGEGGALSGGDGGAASQDGGASDGGAQDSGPVSHPETGQLEGIVEAHNVIRRMTDPDDPLPDLTWNEDAAAYAQSWAEGLAEDCGLMHTPDADRVYGENLAQIPVSSSDNTAEGVVNAWADEVDCWTYGSIDHPQAPGTEQCDLVCATNLNSNGCGHYTQVVWRNTTSVGCGVARCTNGLFDIWACSYDPFGNWGGQFPY